MNDDPIEVEVVEIDDSRPTEGHPPPRRDRSASVQVETTSRRIAPPSAVSTLLSWVFGILLFLGILFFGIFIAAGFLLLLLVRSILSLFRPSSSSLSRRW